MGKYAGDDAQRLLNELITPEMLKIIAGTIAVWAVMQFFGVGEILDIIMLAIGVATLGRNAVAFAEDLATACQKTLGARSDPDLEEAAQYLGHAIVEGGVEVILALLLRKDLGEIRLKLRNARNMQPGLLPVPPKPPAGAKPTLRIVRDLGGDAGETDVYGNITLAREGLREVKVGNVRTNVWVKYTTQEMNETLLHEVVHRFFSPKLDVLREFRASVGITGYQRLYLLRYLEEMFAEGYAATRARGLTGIWVGISFPIKYGYVSLWDLAATAGYSGAIFIGMLYVSGRSIKVFMTPRQLPGDEPTFIWNPPPNR
ncbi:MAG TPA: hypothetical protein VKC66_18140 [Xanthobacteraceae bacterium]|nr:hypothetical protein [Xanthobacteraceae bacterium]